MRILYYNNCGKLVCEQIQCVNLLPTNILYFKCFSEHELCIKNLNRTQGENFIRVLWREGCLDLTKYMAIEVEEL